jgi:hypothetical protein
VVHLRRLCFLRESWRKEKEGRIIEEERKKARREGEEGRGEVKGRREEEEMAGREGGRRGGRGEVGEGVKKRGERGRE